VFSVVAVTGAAGRAPVPAAQGKGGADAVKAVADAYVKATLAGDAKAIAALYADDAIEMPPNQPMIKGRAAIEQYYVKQMGPGVKMTSFTLTHLDTQVAGDQGYDVGTYQQSLTVKDAPAPIKDTGKYTVIVKRVGGAWKVAHAIYNSDQPPPKQ
jgi:uncharacterized protein (TIGR02246 family)